MLHDLRHAIRLVRNSPGFSAVAIGTIALALGANTAMFSFVQGVLLSPLPYSESDRIVRVLERLPTGGLNSVSTLNYLDWTGQNAVFEYLAAEVGWRATLTGGDEPLSIPGARVSAHYFDIFGTKPALGRTFLPEEDQAGRDHVVLLSHRLWETRFGADTAVLGRNILLDGEAYTVVGILERGGPFDRATAQIWRPLAFEPSNMTRDFRWFGASGKLRPGVTLEKARAEMDVIGQRLADAHPDSNRGWSVAVDRLADVVIGPGLRTAITVLFAATLFVVLIGCANLANLALARSLSRQSELAVRAALGASRWHLEWVAKLTDRPLVLQRMTWYGRLTDSEAVRHDPGARRRRLMDAGRTIAAETAATQSPARGSKTASGPGRADRDSVCAAQRYSLEDVAEGDGLRLGQHLLAAAGEMAARWRLEAAASRVADRITAPRPARSRPRGRRQCVAPRAAGGKKTGPNPTDRRKAGSKHHVLTDANGIPVVARLTSANRHDVTQLLPLVDAIPPLRGCPGRPLRKPGLVQGDRGYDSQRHRDELERRGIASQLAKRGRPHGSGLGRTRWVVERTLAWLHRFRRLNLRYERRPCVHEAFLTLACALVCWNYLKPVS